MLSLVIPDNLETDADFERAYWRVALPAVGLCAGVVGLFELWHAGPIAFGLGVGAALRVATGRGFTEWRRGFSRPIRQLSTPLLAMEDAVLEASKKRNAADFSYKEALSKAHAKAQEARQPTIFNPPAICCPYPEHGPHCKVEYDAMRHSIYHRFDGKMVRIPVEHVEIKHPRYTVRIVS